jgi:ABC-type Fe3+-siderophore transport system permease subunit
LLAEGVKMTRRIRIAISAGLMAMSVTAVAAAASRTGLEDTTSPVGLLTCALGGIVLTFLLWSDELDRSSVRRARAAQRRQR